MSLTAPEHQHSAAVEEAARWLASQPRHSAPVPLLRERFGLTALEACESLAMARRLPIWRAGQ